MKLFEEKKMSNRLLATDILRMDEETVWSLLEKYNPGEIVPLVFTGGKVKLGKLEVDAGDAITQSNIQYSIISWYFWELHRLYPLTPLLPKHHLSTYNFTSSVTPTLLTNIVKSIITAYNGKVDYDLLAQQIYQISNNLYNMAVKRLGAYVETVSAIDYIHVLYHPEIVKLRETFIGDPNTASINELYRKIPETVAKPGFLPPGNALVSTMNIRETSIDQINQCIGARGRTTDLDSYMFPNTITECYATGLTNIADFIQESRSATKYLMFQKDPIRDTEYFNRRLQLIAQTMQHVVPGDCGTQDTFDWMLQPDDLKYLSGRNYYNEQGELVSILDEREHRSNVGKIIRLRSPLMCKHKRHGAICETCFGKLADTLPKGTNVGHLIAYQTGQKITQKVLSVKHLDYSTEIKDIVLDKLDLKHVHLDKEHSEMIHFNDNIRKLKNPTMLLLLDEVTNITQAMVTDKLTKLSIYKVSTLTKIGIRYSIEEDIEIIDWVTVSGPSRPSSLTLDMLEYIREVKYQQQDSKFLEVPLSGWDTTKPAFQLPQKQINMLDFMKQFSDMLECGPRIGVKKGLDPSLPEDIVSYVRSVFDYASQYVNLPLIYIETLALCVTATDIANKDYRIANDNYKREFVSSDGAMHFRSVGTALAYEDQANVIYNSLSYNPKYKVDHPMNSLFLQNPNANLYKLWDYEKQQVNEVYSKDNLYTKV